MERIWEYGCNDMLKANMKDHPLMIADSSFCRSQQPQREKLVELLFETFAPPALYLGRSAVLSA